MSRRQVDCGFELQVEDRISSQDDLRRETRPSPHPKAMRWLSRELEWCKGHHAQMSTAPLGSGHWEATSPTCSASLTAAAAATAELELQWHPHLPTNCQTPLGTLDASVSASFLQSCQCPGVLNSAPVRRPPSRLLALPCCRSSNPDLQHYCATAP